MSQNISQRLYIYPNQDDNAHFFSFPLAPGETIIGSSTHCTITLDLPQISLQHCKLTISQEGDIKIKALNTEYGVYRATPSNPRKPISTSRDIVHLAENPFYLSNLYKCVIEINKHAPLDSNSPHNGVPAPGNNLHNEPAEPENDTGDHLGLSSEVRQTLLLSEADEENHQQTLSENAGDDLDHNSNREYFTNSMAQHLETEDGQNTLVLPEDEEDPDSYVTPQSKNMSRFPESAESGKTQLMSTFGEEGQGTVNREDRGYPTPQSRGTPVTNNEKSKNSSQVIPQEERPADLPPTLLLSDEEEEEERVGENGDNRDNREESNNNGRVVMEEEVQKPQGQGKQFKAPENKMSRGRGMEEENPEKIEENLPTQVLTMSMTEDQEPPTQTLPESTQEHGHEENDPIKLSEYDKDNTTTFMLDPSQKTEMDIVSAATVPKDEDHQTQLIPQNQSQLQSISQKTLILPSSGMQENNNKNSGMSASKDRIERSTTMPIDADDDEEEEENEDAMEEEDGSEEQENAEEDEDRMEEEEAGEAQENAEDEEEEIRTTVAMEERESIGDPDRLQETLTLQPSQGLSEQHHEDQEEEIPKSELTSDRAKATTLRDTVRDNEIMSIRGASTPVDDYRSVLSGFENKSEATTTSGHRAEAPTQRDQSSVREASTPKDEYRSLTSGGRGQARTRIDSIDGQDPKEEDRRTRSDRSERRDPPTQSEMMEPPSQESTGQIMRAKKEQISEITKKMGLVGLKAPAALRQYFGLESPPPEEKEEAKSNNSNRNSNRNVSQIQHQNSGVLNETQIFSPTQNTINMSLNMSQMSEAEVNIMIKTNEGFSDTTSQKVRFKGRGPKVYEASEGYIEEEEKIQKKATTESDPNRDWVISDWLEDDNKKQKQEEREAEKEFTVRKKGRGRSNTTGKKKAPAKSLERDEEEEEYYDGMEPRRKRVHQERKKSEPKKKNNKPESKPKSKPKPKAQPKSQPQPKKTVVKNTKKGKTKKPWDEDEEEDEYHAEEEEEVEEEEYIEEIQPKVVKQRGRKNTKVANLKMEEEEEPVKERKGFLLIPPRRIMTRASSKDIPVNTSNDRKDSLESEKSEIVATKKKVNTRKIEKKEEKIETIVTKKEAVGRRKNTKATQLEEYEEEEEQPQPKRRGRKQTTTKKVAEDIEVMDTLQKKKEETKSKGKKTTSKGKKKKKEPEIKTETYDSLEEVTLSDLELVKRNTFKVMFTGFGKEDHDKVEEAKDTLNRLGIKVVEESAQNFNLLIMDKFKRTIKFLLAINRGIDIVSYKWIEECLEEEDIMEPRDYIFSDKKAELKYKFKLEKSLKIAKERTNGFLDEYRIFLPSNIKPSFDEVKMLIESADGQVIKSRPTNFQDDLIVVVNDNDDRNIEHFKQLGYTPYSTELIYSGVLHQKLDLKLYKL